MSASDLKKAWNAAVHPPPGWQGDLYFHNRRNQRIRYGYAPALGERKGTVVLTHGYAEHIDLYYETIKKYQKMGYDIWAMDWHGHGKSDRDDPEHPLKPSHKGMMRHVHDLDFFVNNVVKTRHDPQTPLIMSTHSMGGHIGLLYLKKHPGVFDGAVMSAPMFDIYRLGVGSWARPYIRTIFNAASRLGFKDSHVPAHDELWNAVKAVGQRLRNIAEKPASLRAEFRQIIKDAVPNTNLGRPTFGWITAAYRTIVPSLKEDFLKSIKTPILIGSAEHEDLVANDAHERAAKLLPHATRVEIADADHGLWFERDKPFNEWWSHIRSFTSSLSATRPHEQNQENTANDVIAGKDLAQALRRHPSRLQSRPWSSGQDIFQPA